MKATSFLVITRPLTLAAMPLTSKAPAGVSGTSGTGLALGGGSGRSTAPGGSGSDWAVTTGQRAMVAAAVSAKERNIMVGTCWASVCAGRRECKLGAGE